MHIHIYICMWSLHAPVFMQCFVGLPWQIPWHKSFWNEESADYLPMFLEANSEELSLTCWKSLAWLLHSDSQNINNVMQKPFKSSVAALCWVNMRSAPHHEHLQRFPLSLALLPWHGTKPSVSWICCIYAEFFVFGDPRSLGRWVSF